MKKTLTLTFKSSTIILITISLLIGGLVGYFIKPSGGQDRTISVEGVVTEKIEPDEFILYPSIVELAESSDAARAAITDKGKALADAVLAAGANENQLSSSLDIYEDYKFAEQQNSSQEWRATYSLTITVSDAAVADAISDALSGVKGVQGSLQPQSSLSKAKSEEVKNTIRTQAIEAARAQAEQTATDLGKKLGDVVSIEDITNDIFYGGPIPYALESSMDSSSSLPNFTGEQEVEYRVKAVFSIK